MIRCALSVPQDWGTLSCYSKTRVVIRNHALRSWAAGPLGSGSISLDQRHRTRFPLEAGPVSPRDPEKKALRAKQLGAPDPPRGPGPPHTTQTPQQGENRHPARGVRSRHVPAGGGTHAWSRRFPGKARPPTAFNAVDEGTLY